MAHQALPDAFFAGGSALMSALTPLPPGLRTWGGAIGQAWVTELVCGLSMYTEVFSFKEILEGKEFGGVLI